MVASKTPGHHSLSDTYLVHSTNVPSQTGQISRVEMGGEGREEEEREEREEKEREEKEREEKERKERKEEEKEEEEKREREIERSESTGQHSAQL